MRSQKPCTLTTLVKSEGLIRETSLTALEFVPLQLLISNFKKYSASMQQSFSVIMYDQDVNPKIKLLHALHAHENALCRNRALKLNSAGT